jgi:hypothetical protein
MSSALAELGSNQVERGGFRCPSELPTKNNIQKLGMLARSLGRVLPTADMDPFTTH